MDLKIPRASRTCPERSEPSGSVKDTISLYLGNLTCKIFMSRVKYTVDAADYVV